MVRQTILVEFISPGAHDADIVEHGSITGQADSKFNLRPVDPPTGRTVPQYANPPGSLSEQVVTLSLFRRPPLEHNGEENTMKIDATTT